MSNDAFKHPVSGNLITPRGRMLWNSLFQPRKQKDKEGKYEFNLAIPKAADYKALVDAAFEAGRDKFPKQFRDAGGKWPSGIKGPFKKSAENEKLADIAAEFPVFVAARAKDKPGLVGPDGKPVEDPEQVYAGRWARASIQVYGYDTEGNKGVSFGLINVQLLENAEPLSIGGSRPRAETEFEAIETGSDDDSAEGLFS